MEKSDENKEKLPLPGTPDDNSPERPDLNRETPPLTPKYAAKLFFLSFRFSQGRIDLQRNIFEYLHHIRPSWKIDDEEFFKKMSSEAEILIFKYLFPPKAESGSLHIKQGVDKIQIEILGALANLKIKFSSEAVTNELLPDITAKIVAADHYSYIGGGRPREGHDPRVTAKDKFLSHICHFGFLGHPTGSEEYDQMFREVTQYIKKAVSEGSLDQSTLTALEAVIRIYNEKHPGSQVLFK